MIKGHSKIILTDVNSGEIEIHENDNMVTNALNSFLQPTPCGNGIAAKYYNDTQSWKSILGGVELFDKRQDENADNVIDRSDMKVVARAAVGFTNYTADATLGNFNELESGVQPDGTLKIVYEWQASQGNGTINSISLTSDIEGKSGKGTIKTDNDGKYLSDKYSTTEVHWSGFYAKNLICLDYLKNIGYFMTTIDASKMKIAKHKINLSSFDMRLSSNVADNFLEYVEIAFPEELTNFLGGNSSAEVYWYSNVSNNEVWIFLTRAYNAELQKNSRFAVAKINVDTLSVTEYHTLINNIDDTFSTRAFMVCNGYIFFGKRYNQLNQYTILKANIADFTQQEYFNVEKYVAFTTAFGSDVCFLSYGDSSLYDCIGKKLVTQDAILVNSANYLYGKAVLNNPLLYALCATGSTYEMEITKFCNYKATINNLSKPVVKTAAKSMKLIYTLTFNEETKE